MILDDQEQELLLLLANENTIEEMAAKLGMSERKVQQLIHQMLSLFQVKTEVGLIKEAIRIGIIQND